LDDAASWESRIDLSHARTKSATALAQYTKQHGVIAFASLVFSAVLPFTMLTRSIQNYALLEHENVLHVEAVFLVLLLFLFRRFAQQRSLSDAL